jgi:hypothetical protein
LLPEDLEEIQCVEDENANLDQPALMQARVKRESMCRMLKGTSGWLTLFSIRTKTIKMRMTMIMMK